MLKKLPVLHDFTARPARVAWSWIAWLIWERQGQRIARLLWVTLGDPRVRTDSRNDRISSSKGSRSWTRRLAGNECCHWGP